MQPPVAFLSAASVGASLEAAAQARAARLSEAAADGGAAAASSPIILGLDVPVDIVLASGAASLTELASACEA